MNQNPTLKALQPDYCQNPKLSPITSPGTPKHVFCQILDQQNCFVHEQHNQLSTFLLHGQEQTDPVLLNPEMTLNRFQKIESEVMAYFQVKNVKAGHPEDYKKEYNKKLHKRVSMMVEVNQILKEKSKNGSSLLQRRKNLKITITP